MPAVFVHQTQELRLVQNTPSTSEMLYGKALNWCQKAPYFPIQKRLKISPNKSSGVNSPVILLSPFCASRSSSASISSSRTGCCRICCARSVCMLTCCNACTWRWRAMNAPSGRLCHPTSCSRCWRKASRPWPVWADKSSQSAGNGAAWADCAMSALLPICRTGTRAGSRAASCWAMCASAPSSCSSTSGCPS